MAIINPFDPRNIALQQTLKKPVVQPVITTNLTPQQQAQAVAQGTALGASKASTPTVKKTTVQQPVQQSQQAVQTKAPSSTSLSNTLTNTISPTVSTASSERTITEPTTPGQDTSFANLRALLSQTARFQAAAGPSAEDYLKMYANAGIPLTSPQAISSALDRGTISRAGMIGDVYKSALDLINEQEQRQNQYRTMVFNSLPDSIKATMTGQEFDEIRSGNISPELKQRIAEAQLVGGGTTKRDTKIEEIDGKKWLIDMQTGEPIRELAFGETGLGGINFNDFKSTYASERSSRVLQSVDNLLEIATESPGIFGKTAALPIGDYARSDAFRNYSAMSKTLAAGIGFTELNEMREASKTGGALGQVSERELSLLESSLGALDMTQTPDQVINQLNQIKDSVNRWKAAKNAADLKPLYESLGADETYEEAAVKYGFDQVLDVLEKAAESAPKVSTPDKVLGLGPVTGFGSKYWAPGLDIDLKIGDPVPSPVSGTVAFVGKNGGFGNQVRITTSDGSSVWLSHLDSFGVKEGDYIRAGQFIGKGGNTGNVYSEGGGDGSHLDLTVVDSTGEFMDPRDIYNILLG